MGLLVVKKRFEITIWEQLFGGRLRQAVGDSIAWASLRHWAQRPEEQLGKPMLAAWCSTEQPLCSFCGAFPPEVRVGLSLMSVHTVLSPDERREVLGGGRGCS